MVGGVEWMTVVVVFCPLVSKLKWLSAPPVLTGTVDVTSAAAFGTRFAV